MNKIIIVCTFLLASTYSFAQKKITRSEYIQTYAPLAVKEMNRVGVPASIKLAQACLESDNGNSALALEARNHFGIKCHSSWTGKKYYMDDDAKNECFRVYADVYNSFIDHSNFLQNGQRYAFLFNLPSNDYKAWAHGLKKAGYATNPNYANLLIRIIEDNELYKYDNSETYTIASKHKTTEQKTTTTIKGKAPVPTVKAPVPQENRSIKSKFNRQIYKNNGVEFIIKQEYETMFLISKTFSIPVWKLYIYNDLEPGQTIEDGGIIYIQHKKLRAEKPYSSHSVKQGETIQSIAQLYGIKAKRLAKMNGIESIHTQLEEGSNIYVRKDVFLME